MDDVKGGVNDASKSVNFLDYKNHSVLIQSREFRNITIQEGEENFV